MNNPSIDAQTGLINKMVKLPPGVARALSPFPPGPLPYTPLSSPSEHARAVCMRIVDSVCAHIYKNYSPHTILAPCMCLYLNTFYARARTNKQLQPVKTICSPSA
jgi:hypothetical protein